jgi:trans-aconitate methyltransferase
VSPAISAIRPDVESRQRLLNAAGQVWGGPPEYATVADVTAWEDLEPASADILANFHQVQRLPDPFTFFDRAAAALRHEGVLLVTVPNTGGMGSHVMQETWPWLDPANHRTHFTGTTLRNMAAQAGFIAQVCTTHAGDFGAGNEVEILRRISNENDPQKLIVALEDLDRRGAGEEIVLIARKRAN